MKTKIEQKTVEWHSEYEEPQLRWCAVLVRADHENIKHRKVYYVWNWINQNGMKGFVINGEVYQWNYVEKHTGVTSFEWTYLTDIDADTDEVIAIF